ncbi:MAG: MG2 domain-containing protein, partial [Bacteroidales bacterium]|nr:MG2 domain-containing protein [Bacteroidales bacterium]
MKTEITSFTLFLFIAFFSLNLNAQKMTFYKTQWQKIDSLEKKGLPKSALQVVDEIYEKAKTENNSQQVIKSFIFKLKYKNQIEENAFEKLCKELDSTAQTASFPDNAIMNSMLADMYWWYYQNNRYKFQDRTNTANFDNNDMQTWTLDYLVEKTIKAYTNSVSDPAGLQKIPASDYKELIIKGNKPKNLRPTLYDFLVNKAIDFFSSTEISLTKPADNFEIEESYYFDDTQSFANKEISSSDFLSLHFHGICLLQDLIKFRLSDTKNKDALIDADLKRLQFVYSFSVNPKKDELYMNALEKLEKKYSDIPFSSEISYKIAALYHSLSSKYNSKNKETEKYKYYNKKALDICNNLIQKYPKTHSAELAKSLSITIQQHNISVETEKTISSDSKFAAKITYKNINEIYIRIAKIDRNKYLKLAEKRYGTKFYDKIFQNSTTIKQFSQTLPDDGDFNTHSAELLNDGLDVGFYLIFISDNKNFTYNKGLATYKDITISDISYVSEKPEDGSQKFWVLNRKTGQPLQGVKCTVWNKKYNYALRKYIRNIKATYTTDKNGIFSIFISPEQKSSYNNWSIDFKLGNDFLTSEGSFYLSNYEKDYNEYRHTYFFTDRAIYRPGQTVYFKGISILSSREKNQIVTNKEETVALYDVNYQKVSELKLKTNEFGTFSGTFTLPQGLLNGEFQIKSYYGTVSFSVEEYKRPKFEVKMLPFKGNYLLKETVTAEGEAKSYAGSPLSDATVKYRIIRTPKWRGW